MPRKSKAALASEQKLKEALEAIGVTDSAVLSKKDLEDLILVGATDEFNPFSIPSKRKRTTMWKSVAAKMTERIGQAWDDRHCRQRMEKLMELLYDKEKSQYVEPVADVLKKFVEAEKCHKAAQKDKEDRERKELEAMEEAKALALTTMKDRKKQVAEGIF